MRERGQGRGGLHQVPRKHRRGIAREGKLAGKRCPADDAEGVEIAGRRGRIATDQFGGQVARRAEHRPHVDGVAALGESEVAEQRAAGGAPEHVVDREVAVHDAVGVGVVERPGDLAEDARGVVGGERSAAPEPRAERLAIDHGHHQQRCRVGFLDGSIFGTMRGWASPAGGVCLAQEARARLGVGGECRVQCLDRDRSLEAEVARQVDRPHPAAAESSRSSE